MNHPLTRLAIVFAATAAFVVPADEWGPPLAGHLAHLAAGFLSPPLAAWAWSAAKYDWRHMWLGAAVFGMAVGLFQPPRDIWWFWGNFAALIVLLAIWFWNSTRRKRATQALGNKARAIRARLTRTMRERAIPLPQPA